MYCFLFRSNDRDRSDIIFYQYKYTHSIITHYIGTVKIHTHTHYKTTICEAGLTLHECLENALTKRADPHIIVVPILNLYYTDKQPRRPWTDGQTHVTRLAQNSIFKSLSSTCDRSRIERIEIPEDRSQSIKRIYGECMSL